jgi:Polyketide cyclase / dehydrase and lipid transport
MPRVSHQFVVDRPIEPVFEFVTTARFWPQWHPATRGVEGDIDNPAVLGDRITEHVTVAGISGSGTWTVVECTPPQSMALEADLGAGLVRISYRLDAVADGQTRFQRDLEFPELGPAIGAAMEDQSATGVANLARLIEAEVPAPA